MWLTFVVSALSREDKLLQIIGFAFGHIPSQSYGKQLSVLLLTDCILIEYTVHPSSPLTHTHARAGLFIFNVFFAVILEIIKDAT